MAEDSKKSPIPNHIIVGLGGTGGRIIRALRRTIYEEFREKDPVAYTRDDNGHITGKTEHRVKLGYVYLDSNPELMGPEDTTWKIPGGTLQLGNASQILIGAGNLRSVIDNVNSYPSIKPWIGSKESWHAILDGQVNDAQGGQKRRLGRFLFASSSGSNTPGSFGSTLQTQVSELTNKGDARCVFHVCAGLAGGTGGGTVVDVVSQIRKLYPYAGTHLIVLYLMLPEANPDPAWARANYHANGYAALVELNAMNVGAYKPYDLSGTGQRIDFSTVGTNPVSAFDGCYVFSNINENNKMVGVADYELHGVVASYLFQKIVVVDDNQWSLDTLKKFEECENGDPQTGDNHPERVSDEPGSQLLRSRRFLTFGIKRLVIPEEEIREFMCYCFARQGVLQSLYNNWSDNFGYTQEPRNENVVELVRGAEARNRWKLSNEHLTLSSPILDHEKTWKPLDAEWDVVEKLQLATREKESDHRLWLSGLSAKCVEFYEATFRGYGVEKFFATKEADAKDQAREICQIIEADLFSEWREGKHSVHDLGRKLDEILKMLNEFRTECDERIVEFKRKAGETDEKSRLVNAIEQNNREWFKVGPLSEMMGKRKEILDAQTVLYKKLYEAKTRVHAWTYAKKLSSLVIEEVARLKTSVANIVSRLVQAVDGDTSRKSVNHFSGLDERIADRCRTDEKEDIGSDIIKIYDPKRVRDFTARLVKDRNLQRMHTERLRQRICTKLDRRAGFFAMENDYPLPKLFDFLEEVSDDIVETSHNELVASDSSVTPVLGQNIIKGLAARFPDKMDLRSFVTQVMSESGLFLQFDRSQENMDSPGCCKGSRLTNVSIVIPTSSKGETEFYDQLKTLFKEARAGVQLVNGSRGNVLTILGLSNLFPLRYASHINFLKNKFDARVNSGTPERDARARMELFTEGDGTQFPDLFALSGAQIREKAIPLLTIFKEMGLIKRLSHHQTGEDLGWSYYDEATPGEPPVMLGLTDRELIENCDGRFVNKMEMRISSELARPDTGFDLRRKLEGAIQALVAKAMTDFPNPADPNRQQVIKSLEEAKRIVSSRPS